ncbi:DUF393 domain-containing protein [Streptomyces sp. LP11]|uniref:DUF393 domain-containing protein n=1 Tax=Streptomyces pyxinicus TaxID=2970331 RepID=A0ABT2B888_9ACTN|nr:DUF393 domain-containing protein [Streptomyces sp. LP11]MCS0604734.1 DUF393 domain-containing protein [Streptomyces sp. LP11]
MAAATTAHGRDASGVPVRGLTVLYDAERALGVHLRGWLVRQSQLVPLDLLPAGSAEARARFPGLGHGAARDEVTVVGDAGQVYRGASAWIVVLWALREHRPRAHRLATPAGARLARGAVLAAAKWRGTLWQNDGGSWGGQTYRRADGWEYHRDTGWVHRPPSGARRARATR